MLNVSNGFDDERRKSSLLDLELSWKQDTHRTSLLGKKIDKVPSPTISVKSVHHSNFHCPFLTGKTKFGQRHKLIVMMSLSYMVNYMARNAFPVILIGMVAGNIIHNHMLMNDKCAD